MCYNRIFYRTVNSILTQYISLNLWPQIAIRSHKFESMPTDSNLWPQIAIRSHRFKSVPTDSNLWPQIAICPHRFEPVATD